ncbi:MAG: nucleotide sugar dehydrogenase [Nitrospirota bacterium]
MEDLTSKIKQKKIKVGIIGLGYVGLPLTLRFCEESFSVTGFDIDKAKVESLNRGESYIRHIPSDVISNFLKQGFFEATTDFNRLSDMDCILICVPTPLNEKKEPEMRFIIDTARQIANTLRKGQFISLESTTYPGTTEELLLPMFEEKGFKPGKDFYLVFSPEREDPGNKSYTTKTIPKIIGGVTSNCASVGEALYSSIIKEVIVVSSPKVAEMTKLLENIFRCVNIALVNELKMLCDRMGIDVWEVINAASTKPFGFMPFYPGPGLGGHCIPIDPFYLSWKAREYDFRTRFIELAGEINTNMPYYVVSRVIDALNEDGKPVKGSRILILGIAYKKDIDDLRESPSLELIRLLKEKGARVDYNDPYIPLAISHRKGLKAASREIDEEMLRSYDCVIIATDHALYDYKWITENSRLVVDTRNATKGINSSRIVKA